MLTGLATQEAASAHIGAAPIIALRLTEFSSIIVVKENH